MKRIAFITLILLPIWNLGYSQKCFIELDINGKKIDYFRNLERELGSMKFNSDQTYISGGNVAQPEIFIRKEKNLPDLLVYYTYFKKDSTISEINYEWDVYNFDKKDNNIKSLDFEKNLINKYNSIIDIVSSKFGKSEVDGTLDDLSKINTNEGLKRSDVWKPSDSLKIYAYTTISNYYIKDQFVTVNPTHRIRLYVYNLKENKPEKLSQEKVKLLDEKFNSFILLLSNDNFEEAKKLFSDKIINTVTADILKEVKHSIKINTKLNLYMTGMQVTQHGNIYPMLQYKYFDDISSPPKEYIIILFDNDNKIIGLQPMKRQ
jgi:hypothetical protein